MTSLITEKKYAARQQWKHTSRRYFLTVAGHSQQRSYRSGIVISSGVDIAVSKEDVEGRSGGA
jgi:hypothetical protein